MKTESSIYSVDERMRVYSGGARAFARRFCGKSGLWGVLAALCALSAFADGEGDYSYRQLGRDRVLLMNNDSNPLNPITYQGYYNTDQTAVAYWVHTGPEPATAYRGQYLNYKAGTNHTYYANIFDATGAITGRRTLWQLVDCRAGSAAVGYQATSRNGRNCLPWSKTAEPIDYLNTASPNTDIPIPAYYAGRASDLAGVKQVASVVMRNSKRATIYSPVYTNGVGSVFFDAVNGSRQYGEELVMSVATNVTADVDAKDVADEDWFVMPVARYAVKDCETLETLDSEANPAGVITLAANDDLTGQNPTNYFYRIHAAVQDRLGGYTGPLCFKLERTTSDTSATYIDSRRVVLVDNIQVSYPTPSFELGQYGKEDFSLTGKQAVGHGGAFTVPFPAAGQKGVKPRAYFTKDLSCLPAKVTDLASGDGDMEVGLRLDGAKLYYRWRYLNQILGSWASMDLTPDYDAGTLSGEELTLGAIPGDLEYYVNVDYCITHFKPVDYALCTHTSNIENVGYGDAYSGTFSALLRRTDASGYDNGDSPSGGTDYFVRLREGESDYESFDIDLCWGESYETATNRPDTVSGLVSMELVTNGIWRGVWEMPTNAVGNKLYVAFKGNNRQTAGATEWTEGTDWFIPSAQVDSWPASGLVKAVSGVDWRQNSPMEITSAANALVFTFEEESLTYSVARGDYQNFNRWSNAQGTVFTGNMAATAGVSRAQALLRAPITAWATNYYLTAKMINIGDKEDTTRWEEHFYPMMELSEIKVNEERSGTTLTPNGWDMENGMYVPEQGVLKASDRSGSTFTNVAAQLRGQGMGNLAYVHSSRPEGLNTIEFRSRVGQSVEFANFSQNLMHMSETNYVVCAKAVLASDESGIAPVDPSVSLVAYYRQNLGAYEMRTSRVITGITTRNRVSTTNYYIKVELYRWNCAGGIATPTMLHRWYLGPNNVIPSQSELTHGLETRYVCAPTTMMCVYSATNAPSYYLGASTSGTKVDIFCGVGIVNNDRTMYNDMPSQNGGILMLSTNMTSAISTIPSYTDTSSSRLLRGTYGLGANNCRAIFRKIFHTPLLSSGAVGSETFANINESSLVAEESSAIKYPNSYAGLTGQSDWGLPKMTIQDGAVNYLAANTATQTLHIAARATSGGTWTNLVEVPVTSYSFKTSNVTVRYPEDCYLRLATGGTVNDERTDVVVDDVSFTRLRGGNHPSIENYDGSQNWVFTQTWPTGGASNPVASFQPIRGLTNMPMSIRTEYITNGLSVFGFSWKNANAGVTKLLIQTNGVARSAVNSVSLSVDDSTWVTVTNLTIASATGSFAHAFKCRAPFNGLFRVMMAPSVIADATASTATATTYGRIDITNMYFWDDPSLDGDFWWGWNMRTTDEGEYEYLPDATNDPETGIKGLSGILNYTAREDQSPNFETYPTGVNPQWSAHSPFIQSPYLSNGVGKITFKARAFDNLNPSSSVWYPSTIALYGVKSDTDAADGDWEPVCDPFVISNSTYQTYSWETHDQTIDYRVIRFVVRGAQNGRTKANQPTGDNIEENLINYYAVDDWYQASRPNAIMRVCLDEIMLSEKVDPQLGFLNALPFRDDLDGTNAIPDEVLTSYNQQPLLDESFGFQVQVVPEQMRELIDFDTLKVYFAYHVGKDVWGYQNWSNDCVEIELPKAADWTEDRMVYRSRGDIAPESIVPSVTVDENAVASVVVQYTIKLVYKDTDGNDHVNRLTDDTARYWTNPAWYGSFDANDKYTSGTSDANYTPYTVLETLSPKRAWINEVNLWDGELWSNTISNQFFEVAVPAGVSINGWKLKLTEKSDSDEDAVTDRTHILAEFGLNNLPASKIVDTTNDYAFIAVKSPMATCEASGSWLPISAYGEDLQGKLQVYRPYALELVRPSDIVEHRIVFGGENPGESERLKERYSSERLYEALTNYYGEASGWIYLGDDTNKNSIAVCTTNGEFRTQWRESSRITPGKVNLFDDDELAQFIVPGWYLTPNGDTCWIRAYLTTDYLAQDVGDGLPTAIFHVKKYNPAKYDPENPVTWGGGTNITYTASPWYYISSLSTNGVDVSETASAKLSTFTLKITNVSENVSIYAGAGRNFDVLTGLTENSRYSNDVFDWITEKSPDAESEIYLADVNPAAGAALPTENRMPLEEMYWLDIDPFTTNAFYIGAVPTPEIYPQVDEDGAGNLTNAFGSVVVETKNYHPALTNFGVTVYAYVSNVEDNVVWKPTYLQGLDRAVSGSFGGVWTSATFKVRGYLLNASGGRYTLENITAPLRQFIIDAGSFEDYPIPDMASPYSALVNVVDPFSELSPAYAYPYNWARWDDEANAPMWRGKSNVYWSFSIDDQQLGSDPAILK